MLLIVFRVVFKVTPFASILQSIFYRLQNSSIRLSLDNNRMNLKKVDFVWINRNHKSFEWFIKLLHNLETEQLKLPEYKRILNFHMYITSATNRTDIRSLLLQLALDLMREKTDRDFITGMRQRVHWGRPDWDEV